MKDSHLRMVGIARTNIIFTTVFQTLASVSEQLYGQCQALLLRMEHEYRRLTISNDVAKFCAHPYARCTDGD